MIRHEGTHRPDEWTSTLAKWLHDYGRDRAHRKDKGLSITGGQLHLGNGFLPSSNILSCFSQKYSANAVDNHEHRQISSFAF